MPDSIEAWQAIILALSTALLGGGTPLMYRKFRAGEGERVVTERVLMEAFREHATSCPLSNGGIKHQQASIEKILDRLTAAMESAREERAKLQQSLTGLDHTISRLDGTMQGFRGEMRDMAQAHAKDLAIVSERLRRMNGDDH